MPHISFQELREGAARLGHANMTVVPMRPSEGLNWWRGECGCGYRSTRRNSQADAAGALVHHLMKAVQYNSTGHPDTHAGLRRNSTTGRRPARTTPHRPALTDGLDDRPAAQSDTPVEQAS
jgi:hypothetical protein